MSSNALVSQGMTIGIGDGASPEVYSTISDVISMSGPGGSSAVIDVTDLSSTAKEKRMGLPDEGQVTMEMNYIPANVQHALLRSKRASQTAVNFRITFTDSPQTKWTFLANVLGFSINNGVDGVTTASVTLEISGSVIES